MRSLDQSIVKRQMMENRDHGDEVVGFINGPRHEVGFDESDVWRMGREVPSLVNDGMVSVNSVNVLGDGGKSARKCAQTTPHVQGASASAGNGYKKSVVVVGVVVPAVSECRHRQQRESVTKPGVAWRGTTRARGRPNKRLQPSAAGAIMSRRG